MATPQEPLLKDAEEALAECKLKSELYAKNLGQQGCHEPDSLEWKLVHNSLHDMRLSVTQAKDKFFAASVALIESMVAFRDWKPELNIPEAKR